MSYNEVVYNSVEDHCQQDDAYNLDETPPPLPPRTHSLLPLAGSGADGTLRLNLVGTNSHGKPLPKIPASVSFNDDLYAPDNDKTNKDAMNNFINNEKISETNMTHRPLPPLPTQNSLDRVHESDSDEKEYFDDDSDEDVDEDDEENDVEINENNDAADDTERQRNIAKHNNHHHNSLSTNDKSEAESMKLNGLETANSGPLR